MGGMKIVKNALLVASMTSFVSSLLVPAFYFGPNSEPYGGLTALIAGAFGVMAGFFCWLANPVLLLIWIAAIRERNSGRIVVASLVNLALCLSFLFHGWIYTDENGGKAAIAGVGPGFVLWVLATALMIAWGTFALRQRKNHTDDPVEKRQAD
jgi:hypothetical protein